MDNSDLDIGVFESRDAEGITELFKTVYGDGYPIRIFYDAESLKSANNNGEYISVVARLGNGRVIGVHNLYRSAPYEKLYEWGVGLVYQEYRGEGVSKRIGQYLINTAIPNTPVEEIFGEPVCNHVITQKLCVDHHLLETALEVALMPAEAYSAEKSAVGRVATLLAFRQYHPKPHKVFLPQSYEDPLRFIYEALDDERTLEITTAELPDTGASEGETTIFDFAAVSRTAVRMIGADFESFVDRVENDGERKGVEVYQIWIKADQPSIHGAVELLRDRGYFFGGALPRWFDEDGLLMQKLLCDPGFEHMKLLTERANAIRDIVREDELRTHAL